MERLDFFKDLLRDRPLKTTKDTFTAALFLLFWLLTKKDSHLLMTIVLVSSCLTIVLLLFSVFIIGYGDFIFFCSFLCGPVISLLFFYLISLLIIEEIKLL